MSLETLTFASNGERLERIPNSSLAYISQRARNACYDLVMKRFLNSGMTKAELARRIRKSQPHINHVLASPANWTIRTMAELLAGIDDEEFVPTALPFKGRKARNFRQEDFFTPRPEAKTSGSGSFVAATLDASPKVRVSKAPEMAELDG